MKDGFVVGFFSAEQVIHNACEFMSCGGDRLGFAELASDTPKELAEIVFGVIARSIIIMNNTVKKHQIEDCPEIADRYLKTPLPCKITVAYENKIFEMAKRGGVTLDIAGRRDGGMLTTLYSFCAQANCADGALPVGSLAQGVDGNLYGTTVRGGVQGNCPSGSVEGCGTIFKITLSGVLATLYTFCAQGNCPDGADPYDAMVQATDRNFYGTTYNGGANGTGGTVFSITPGGVLTTLYSFCSQANCSDAADPHGGALTARHGRKLLRRYLPRRGLRQLRRGW